MKISRLIIIAIAFYTYLFVSCTETKQSDKEVKTEINSTIDSWHLTAAMADSMFFDYFDNDAVYIGTDAGERWTIEEFKKFAMPFFKKGKAWDFKPIERHIYLSDDSKLAYFDEKLNTWMGVCRSTGVVVRKGKAWKIKYYHLSMTIPNKKVKEIIEIIKK